MSQVTIPSNGGNIIFGGFRYCCKFLAVFDDGLHVRLRPFGQLGNERHERAAYFRQAVLDLRRHGRIYFAQAFAGAMKKAYPDLPGADGLEDLAKALYK